jgi:hypothetical protein
MHRIWSPIRQLWSETRWIVLGILWLVGLILGYAGFAQYAKDGALDWSAGDILYRTLQLVVLESGSVEGRVNWSLETARFLLPALTAYTALQAVMHLFREQTQWLRLWRLQDHIIVCGLGRKGSHLMGELLELGHPVVAIEKDASRENIARLWQRGAIILEGDATDPAILTSARVQRARYLISLLGDDSHNLQVAVQAYQLRGGHSRNRLTCVIHLNSPDLLNLIKNSELTIDPTVTFQLETFNTYALAARQLLQADPGWQAPASAEEVPRRILIIGMGRLGESLVFQAGYTWHLLKRREELQITVVDQEAKRKVSTLLHKYPQISKTCQLIPLEMDLRESDQLPNLLQSTADKPAFRRAYVCLNDPVLSLQISLNLIRLIGLHPASIQVQLAGESGLSELVRNPLPGLVDANQVRTFDLYEQTCCANLLINGSHELLARDLYAVYQASTRGANADPGASLPWDQLPEGTKEANRRQADRIHRLLQTSGYRINPLQDWDAAERTFQEEEIIQMARQEHDLWRQAKEADGWRVGPQRDEKLRTNPALVPWEALEQDEREKNLAFIHQLPELLARIGFQIDRLEGM